MQLTIHKSSDNTADMIKLWPGVESCPLNASVSIYSCHVS